MKPSIHSGLLPLTQGSSSDGETFSKLASQADEGRGRALGVGMCGLARRPTLTYLH